MRDRLEAAVVVVALCDDRLGKEEVALFTEGIVRDCANQFHGKYEQIARVHCLLLQYGNSRPFTCVDLGEIGNVGHALVTAHARFLDDMLAQATEDEGNEGLLVSYVFQVVVKVSEFLCPVAEKNVWITFFDEQLHAPDVYVDGARVGTPGS